MIQIGSFLYMYALAVIFYIHMATNNTGFVDMNAFKLNCFMQLTVMIFELWPYTSGGDSELLQTEG